MKKVLPLLLILLLALSLTGCRREKAPEPLMYNGKAVEISENDRFGILTYDGSKYYYELSFGSSAGRYAISITYPNEMTITRNHMDNAIATSAPSDWDWEIPRREGWLEPDQIEDLVFQRTGTSPERERSVNPLICLVVMGFGAWALFAPRSVWFLSHGWRYKDAEPSDLAIGLNRVGGALALGLGLLLLIFG